MFVYNFELVYITKRQYYHAAYDSLYVFFCLYDENSDVCFPNFGVAQTPYLMYEVYTNASLHGCVPDSV